MATGAQTGAPTAASTTLPQGNAPSASSASTTRSMGCPLGGKMSHSTSKLG